MGRLVWVGVGAVGGIYTYRKGERAVAALQSQDAVRAVRVVASVGRRPRNPSMAAHPASGGPALYAVPAAAQPGLRVGRFRIMRSDESAHLPPPGDRPRAVAPQPTAAPIQGRDVVDITEASGRRRIGGVTARRRAR